VSLNQNVGSVCRDNEQKHSARRGTLNSVAIILQLHMQYLKKYTTARQNAVKKLMLGFTSSECFEMENSV
jgi:hypothetical protein